MSRFALGALAGALVATVSPGAALYLLLLTLVSWGAVGTVRDIRADRHPLRRDGTASLPRCGVEAGTFVTADPRTREGRDARQRTTSAVTTITMPGPYSRFGRKK